MKFIKLQTEKARDEVLSILKDNERVNENVRFHDKRGGKPYMHIKEKDDIIRIKCEMVGRPTRDNGFLVGTRFSGRLTEKDGVTTLKGRITTSVIYHTIMLLLAVFWLFCIIAYSAYTLIPLIVFAAAFEFMFFKDEFKKQGYIERYILRAFKRIDS
ncbi:MAG: hypothetical protein J6Q69_06750 [Clostridia bacterium]|nr:hypothetical protein [Clostridia bacterium]